MVEAVRMLLVSGSLRAASTNTAVLRTAQAVAPPGVEAVLYEGLADLPHFNPDDDQPSVQPAVVDLRARLAWADATVFSTPEYAGALPGSFKNLLDWSVGGGETYAMPVAWINASASPTGALDAHECLRRVLNRTGSTIVEAACIHVPVPRGALDAAGLVTGVDERGRLAFALATLAGFARQSDHRGGS